MVRSEEKQSEIRLRHMSTLTSFNTVLEILVRAIRSKENKRYQIRKEEEKQTSFVDHNIIYIEKPTIY